MTAEPEQPGQPFFDEAVALARAMLADPATIERHAYQFGVMMLNLRWCGRALPASLAWPLYHAARAARAASPQGDLLISLARVDPAATLPVAQEAMSSQDKGLCDDASEAWLMAQGLPDPFEMAGWIPGRDLHQWPLAAQHIYVLVDLINQVTSNGFSGWCCNGYASRWRLTIEACTAVGADEAAAQVQEAIDAFGPFDGMSESAIADRLKGPQGSELQHALHGPTGQFWDDHDQLRVRMARYMAGHRKLFEMMRPI